MRLLRVLQGLQAGWARVLLRDRVEDVLAVLPSRNIGIPMAPARVRSIRISKAAL